MTLTALTITIISLLGLTVGFLLGTLFESLMERRTVQAEWDRHDRELARLREMADGERDRLVERVKLVEFQLASHVAHLLKLPPPAPLIDNGPKPEPLPDVMVKFLLAIEDEDARGEYEQSFRAGLALGADPHQLVAEALSA